ncbi:hypothetical protein PIB30_070073 [Stylosanthes scabra]|uniref:BED-type domain-containing protein n=1 Tax=Stylosanthes scabra TaxID=79078 RepID=A0ABU6WLP5_9FABA|nr:hypothetical protein [Stylosanthes scabra]
MKGRGWWSGVSRKNELSRKKIRQKWVPTGRVLEWIGSRRTGEDDIYNESRDRRMKTQRKEIKLKASEYQCDILAQLPTIDGISSPETQFGAEVGAEAETLANNEGENQSGEDEEDNEDEGVIQKNKRKKTSFVWQHFKEVKLSTSIVKNQCVHCKRKYAITGSKATSQLSRHLKNNCPGYRKIMLAKQKRLNFPQDNAAEHPSVIGPLLVTPGGKYNH